MLMDVPGALLLLCSKHLSVHELLSERGVLRVNRKRLPVSEQMGLTCVRACSLQTSKEPPASSL